MSAADGLAPAEQSCHLLTFSRICPCWQPPALPSPCQDTLGFAPQLSAVHQFGQLHKGSSVDAAARRQLSFAGKVVVCELMAQQGNAALKAVSTCSSLADLSNLTGGDISASAPLSAGSVLVEQAAAQPEGDMLSLQA